MKPLTGCDRCGFVHPRGAHDTEGPFVRASAIPYRQGASDDEVRAAVEAAEAR